VRREIFEKMINTLYPDQKIEVVSYEILSRDKLGENDKWVSDTPSVFVNIRCEDFDNKDLDLDLYFTDFTGYEFVINKLYI